MNNREHDIVVIGAALGGLTAMAKIAASWPADLPASVLVALATSDQPPRSVLQILKSYAPVSLRFATDGEIVEPKRIYLSPPGKHLAVEAGGHLRVENPRPFEGSTPSVDRLFSSAASVFGPRVIGIVLSGKSRDGAKGLIDIEAAGGLGIVQTPDDAVEPQMPMNAIQNDHPRYCVKASEMAALLRSLMTKSFV